VLRPPLPLEGEFVAEVVAEDEGEPKFDGHVSGIYGRRMKDEIMMGRRGLTPFELAGRFWIQGIGQSGLVNTERTTRRMEQEELTSNFHARPGIIRPRACRRRRR
jgi:hypothetical protein